MSESFPSNVDAVLLSQSAHFMDEITLHGEDYGITPDQSVEYAARQSAFASALAAATDPATRGGSTILAKNTAKKSLIAYSRELARIIQANPAVTNQQRYDLGLHVRKTPAPVPAPTEAPQIDLVSMVGHRMTIRLHNGTATRRGKPAGVSGASIVAYVGQTPPAALTDWTFCTNTGRSKASLDFDSALAPGTKVWVTAVWFNPSKEAGPMATPVSSSIQFGVNGALAGMEESAGKLGPQAARKAA
jgi:hypothetical protein